MKKLLVVEDSALFAKMLSRQLAENNLFEVHVAYSHKEAEVLLGRHEFFAAITDLVLPDADQGEIVTTVVKKNIPVIALTGSMSDELQKQISSMPIVDYVIKEGRSDLCYAVRLAELLLDTKGVDILVVDDSKVALASVVSLLKPLLFNIHTANSGKEALALIKENPKISLIVTDHEMPEMTGLELSREVRKYHDELTLPIIAVTGMREPKLEARFLKSGVNDFLIKPFSREEFVSRVVTLASARERYKQIQRFADTVDRYVISSSTDEHGIIRAVSQAFCEISGYSREELLGRNHNIVRHPDMPDSLYQSLWQTIKSGKSWRGEVKNCKKDGSFYWVDVNIEPQFDSQGQIRGYTAIRQDITDKKYVEELSITDPMTGLYNRRYFSDQFPVYAKKAAAQGELLAFLMFDVDKFKQYNDHYGHQAGDHVLIECAKAFKSLAKEINALPFRLGGEEFALLFTVDTADHAQTKAELARQSIQNLGIPHAYNSAAEVVTASFGLCLIEKDADIEVTYKKADDALYEAKEQGRNRVITLHL